MANLNIVRLRPLTEQTRRLADATERVAHALETLLLHAYGIATVEPSANMEDVDVSYVTDEVTAIREAEEELKGVGYQPVEDDSFTPPK